MTSAATVKLKSQKLSFRISSLMQLLELFYKATAHGVKKFQRFQPNKAPGRGNFKLLSAQKRCSVLLTLHIKHYTYATTSVTTVLYHQKCKTQFKNTQNASYSYPTSSAAKKS